MTGTSADASSAQKIEDLLSIIRRMIDEPDLIARFYNHINEDTFVMKAEAPSFKAVGRMVSLLKAGYARHKKSDQFNIRTFATIISNEEGSDEDEEITKRVKYYTKLIEGVALKNDEDKERSSRILTNSRNVTVLNEMLNRIKLYKFHEWHENSLRGLIKKGDINRGIESMHDTVEAMKDLEFHTSKPFNFSDLEGLVEPQIFATDAKRYLSFGVPEIDIELAGGFYKKTLTGFMAVSGGGKSQMCSHLISLCIKQKMRCHVVSVEEEDRLFATRVIAALTGVETSKILKGYKTLTDAERLKIEEARRQLDKYLILEFIYDKTLDEIHRIKKECFARIKRQKEMALLYPERYGDIELEEDVAVDIVDYSGHLTGGASGEKVHEKFLDAYRSRKNFALQHDVIAFDFIQPNRDGTKKENSDGVLRSTDIAGGFDIIRIFDNLVSINRSKSDFENNEARLWIDKARNGNLKNRMFSVGTDFKHGRFDFSDAKEVSRSLISLSTPEAK